MVLREFREAPEWQPFGLCVSDGQLTDLFYSDGNNTDVQAAKAICFTCPVQERCLEWALDTNEPFGVWGGASERERRRMRKARRIAQRERQAS